MEIKMERRLKKFIEYLAAEVCDKFPEFDLSDDLSFEGAVVVLAWLGLAELVEDDEDEELYWTAGRLSSLRALSEIKKAAHEHSARG
jgi:hypothetical protein